MSIQLQARRFSEAKRNSYTWYDPFVARNHPKSDLLSDTEVFIVLTSAVGGITFLQFPYAISLAGITPGIVLTILTTIVTIHCNFLWVKCSHEMYYRCRVPQLTYEETVILVFTSQYDWLRRFTFLIKLYVQVLLFLAYFTACIVYLETASSRLNDVMAYMEWEDYKTLVTIPSDSILTSIVVLMSFIPNLKKVSIVTTYSLVVTTICYCCMLYITIVEEIPFDADRKLQLNPYNNHLFSLITRSLLSVGLIQPLENVMRHPNHLIEGFCLAGINSVSLTLISIINNLFGIVGYEKFGIKICNNFIQSILHRTKWIYHAFRLILTSAIMGQFPILYYILYGILWRRFHEKFLRWPLLGTIVIKTTLTLSIVLIFVYAGNQMHHYAYTVEVLCTTSIGLMIPAILEMITYWKEPTQIPYFKTSSTSLHSQSEVTEGFQKWHHLRMVIKNVSIIIFAGAAMTAELLDLLTLKESYC